MTEQIEILDQKRKKYRGRTILGTIIFFIAWLLRSIIKIYELEMETFHTAVFIILLLYIFYPPTIAAAACSVGPCAGSAHTQPHPALVWL